MRVLLGSMALQGGVHLGGSERVGGCARTKALLDFCREALHVFFEGSMTMEAAVLDQTESFDLDMHIVLLEPLDEKVDELLASIGGRLRNP
jgi:hypothetical protein